MKDITLFGMLPILLLMLTPTFPANKILTYNVDTTESVINWKASKVTGTHEGTIGIKNGTIDLTDGVLSGGSFEIDFNTMKVTDLEGEWKAKLEGHLHSPDFFNTAAFPTAKFITTKVSPKGTPGDYKVTGDLTIKGITKSIKFYVNLSEAGEQMKATGTLTLDRTDFDIRYGSGSFFDNLGDKTIYDEFDLQIALVAKK